MFIEKIFLTIFIVVCLPSANCCFAADYQAAYVSYASGHNPSYNYGGNASAEISGSGPRHAYIKWDLSSIARGTVIGPVTMTLSNAQSSGKGDICIYEVSQSWSEGDKNGATANSSIDLTWNNKPARKPRLIAKIHDFTAATWTAKSIELTNLVQRWINDPGRNYGIVLISDTAGNAVFYSDDYNAAAQRPMLSFTTQTVGSGASSSVSVTTTTGISRNGYTEVPKGLFSVNTIQNLEGHGPELSAYGVAEPRIFIGFSALPHATESASVPGLVDPAYWDAHFASDFISQYGTRIAALRDNNMNDIMIYFGWLYPWQRKIYDGQTDHSTPKHYSDYVEFIKRSIDVSRTIWPEIRFKYINVWNEPPALSYWGNPANGPLSRKWYYGLYEACKKIPEVRANADLSAFVSCGSPSKYSWDFQLYKDWYTEFAAKYGATLNCWDWHDYSTEQEWSGADFLKLIGYSGGDANPRILTDVHFWHNHLAVNNLPRARNAFGEINADLSDTPGEPLYYPNTPGQWYRSLYFTRLWFGVFDHIDKIACISYHGDGVNVHHDLYNSDGLAYPMIYTYGVFKNLRGKFVACTTENPVWAASTINEANVATVIFNNSNAVRTTSFSWKLANAPADGNTVMVDHLRAIYSGTVPTDVIYFSDYGKTLTYDAAAKTATYSLNVASYEVVALTFPLAAAQTLSTYTKYQEYFGNKVYKDVPKDGLAVKVVLPSVPANDAVMFIGAVDCKAPWSGTVLVNGAKYTLPTPRFTATPALRTHSVKWGEYKLDLLKLAVKKSDLKSGANICVISPDKGATLKITSLSIVTNVLQTVSSVPDKATAPSPANAATVQTQKTVLSWTPSSGANGHDVYVGVLPKEGFDCVSRGIRKRSDIVL